jgi:hypothetical protein
MSLNATEFFSTENIVYIGAMMIIAIGVFIVLWRVVIPKINRRRLKKKIEKAEDDLEKRRKEIVEDRKKRLPEMENVSLGWPVALREGETQYREELMPIISWGAKGVGKTVFWTTLKKVNKLKPNEFIKVAPTTYKRIIPVLKISDVGGEYSEAFYESIKSKEDEFKGLVIFVGHSRPPRIDDITFIDKFDLTKTPYDREFIAEQVGIINGLPKTLIRVSKGLKFVVLIITKKDKWMKFMRNEELAYRTIFEDIVKIEGEARAKGIRFYRASCSSYTLEGLYDIIGILESEINKIEKETINSEGPKDYEYQ